MNFNIEGPSSSSESSDFDKRLMNNNGAADRKEQIAFNLVLNNNRLIHQLTQESCHDQMRAPVLLSDGFNGRQTVLEKSNGDESSTVATEEDEEAVYFGDNSTGDVAEEEGSGETKLCFYFVKQLAYDDPEIQAKIDEADTEIYHCNVERIRITKTLKSKRAEILSLNASIENLFSSVDTPNSYESMNEEKKDQVVITEEIYSLLDRLNEIKVEIELLNAQMVCVLDQRDQAFERIKSLRMQRDKGNAAFFYNRFVMSKANELAACGNVKDLKKLSYSQVKKFMSSWNSDKAFRDDYKKRIVHSLDDRNLSCDGRIRDLKGDADTENKNETVGKMATDLKRFRAEEESDDAMDFGIRLYEKLGKKEEEMDEETLKEKNREEQLEKARLAMERKRRLHEKAAAKAAVRVKKEAEKKLKEIEKRAKKKAAASNSSSSSDGDRSTKIVIDASKPVKEKLSSEKSVFSNQSSFKYKRHGKGNEAVLKAIIKRKKAYRLWVWTVSYMAFAIPLALLIFFYCI